MRHKPKRPPYHPHPAPTLPRVRRLSRGVHFGLACVGILFVAIVVFWMRSAGGG
jgi:hypothetical protein